MSEISNEVELEEIAREALPCGCKIAADDNPIFWNPYNKVVQCHKCGHTYIPASRVTENAEKEKAVPVHSFKETLAGCKRRERLDTEGASRGGKRGFRRKRGIK